MDTSVDRTQGNATPNPGTTALDTRWDGLQGTRVASRGLLVLEASRLTSRGAVVPSLESTALG
jgi:hypothetical protein